MMKKRICLVSSEYPPETGNGGIGTYTRIMAAALSRSGNEVVVISLSEKNEAYEYFDGNVKIVRVTGGEYPLPKGKLFWRFRMAAYKLVPHSLVRLAFAKSVAEAFYKMAKTRKFDIVEAADCGGESYYINSAKETQLVIRLHTPYSFSLKFNNQGIGFLDRKLLESIEKKCVLKAAAVTSPSEALAAHLIREWNIKRVSVFPNPLDYDAFHFFHRSITSKNEHGCIIHTGRVEYRKGVHLLIKAYAELRKNGITEKLVIVGKPYGHIGKTKLSYEEHINSLIEKLMLKNHVIWIHGLPREELLKELRNARIAVFPAVWDNYPYACLEAMVMGIPVVASKTGGFPEIIKDGERGLLASPLNVSDLSTKILTLLQNPELANKFAANALEWVKRDCNAEIVCRLNENAYES